MLSLPDYKKILIDNGLINADMTVIDSLPKVAKYLHRSGIEVTTNILLQFKQKNGDLFTEGTAGQVASRLKAPKD
jgi:hypothetical protein